jgi:hypothetical protein
MQANERVRAMACVAVGLLVLSALFIYAHVPQLDPSQMLRVSPVDLGAMSRSIGVEMAAEAAASAASAPADSNSGAAEGAVPLKRFGGVEKRKGEEEAAEARAQELRRVAIGKRLVTAAGGPHAEGGVGQDWIHQSALHGAR